MTTEAPNYQFPEDSQKKTIDRGTVAMGVHKSSFVPVFDGFENASNPLGFAGTWARTNTEAHTGTWSFKSGVIADGGFTDTVINCPVGGNLLEFWYKVSSEEFFDFLQVFADATLVLEVSGEVDWTRMQIDITTVGTVTFRYVKDGSGSSGDDAAYIDDVTMSGPGIYKPHTMDTRGTLYIQPQQAATTTLSNVADSATSVTLSANNPVRTGWYCYNDSTEPLFVKFGATAARGSFTTVIQCGSYYEMPNPIYTGVIDGIWLSSVGGFARITEIV